MGFDLKKQLKQQEKSNVVSDMLGIRTVMKQIPYEQLEFGDFDRYSIDEDDVKELADSISTIGLEQNLVVKETNEQNRYVIVTGHKRVSAIRYIFDNRIPVNANVKNLIVNPYCIVIPKDEEPIITRIRMHETNIQGRTHLDIKDIEDYYNTIQEAKKLGIKVNGKEIKGTSRAILHTAFGFSETTAKKYIKVFNEGSDEIKEQISNGDITINHAYDVLTKKTKTEPKKTEPKKPKEPKQLNLEDFGVDVKKLYNNTKKLCSKLNENQESLAIEVEDGYLHKKIYDEMLKITDSLKEINRLIIKANE